MHKLARAVQALERDHSAVTNYQPLFELHTLSDLHASPKAKSHRRFGVTPMLLVCNDHVTVIDMRGIQHPYIDNHSLLAATDPIQRVEAQPPDVQTMSNVPLLQRESRHVRRRREQVTWELVRREGMRKLEIRVPREPAGALHHRQSGVVAQGVGREGLVVAFRGDPAVEHLVKDTSGRLDFIFLWVARNPFRGRRRKGRRFRCDGWVLLQSKRGCDENEADSEGQAAKYSL